MPGGATVAAARAIIEDLGREAAGDAHDGEARARGLLAAGRAAGDHFAEACAYEQLGNAAFYRGEVEAAIDAFGASLKRLEALGDLESQAYRLKDLGVCYRTLGRFAEALEVFEEARRRYPSAVEGAFAISYLGNLGSLYARLGFRRLAIDAYREALGFARSVEPPAQAWDLQIRLGILYLESGAYRRAVTVLEQAAAGAARHAGDREASWVLGELGWAYQAIGDGSRARAAASRSLEHARRIDDPLNLVGSLVDLGYFHTDSDAAAAEDFFHQASAAATGNAESLAWQARAGLATLRLRQDRRDEAIELFEHSLELVDSRRRDLVAWQDRSTLASWNRSTYGSLASALLDRGAPGDAERAFEVAEQGMARTLAEALSQIGDAAAIGSEEARALLPPRSALVAYLTSRAGVTVFVLRSDRFAARRLQVDAGDLEVSIEVYLSHLAGGGRWRLASRRLYRQLVRPIAAELEGVDHVVVVADGPLRALPFATLIDDVSPDPIQGLMLSRYAVSTVPSATVLAEIMRRRPALAAAAVATDSPAADLLVVADPRLDTGFPLQRRQLELYRSDGPALAALPGSRREARIVASFAGPGSIVLTGSEATEERLFASRPGRFGTIHFASHALIDPITPRRSALLLTATAGDDGFLQAREIARLGLSARLVVLAACRSARDRTPAGGGVHGLALSFFHAGAAAVVASLWPVDDRITTVAMAAFYRQLAAGHGKASALRRAQLELLDHHGLDAPRHWAPWLLLGEPFDSVPMSGSGRWLPSPPSPLAAVTLGLGCVFAALSWWLRGAHFRSKRKNRCPDHTADSA